MQCFPRSIFIISFIVLSIILLTGCAPRNTVLDVDADTFANSVNTFESLSMANQSAVNCGEYYINPNSNPFGQAMKEDCSRFTQKLANFLAKDSHYSGITANQLQSASVWQHYFQSKKAHGKG